MVIPSLSHHLSQLSAGIAIHRDEPTNPTQNLPQTQFSHVPISVTAQEKMAHPLTEHSLESTVDQSCQAGPTALAFLCTSEWWSVLTILVKVSHLGRCIGLIQKCPPVSLIQTTWFIFLQMQCSSCHLKKSKQITMLAYWYRHINLSLIRPRMPTCYWLFFSQQY